MNRYFTDSQFTSYCSELNIDLLAFNRELELYEKTGMLLPVARIIQPNEYIIKHKQYNQQPDTYGKEIPGWEELERALFGQKSTDWKDDLFLWHYLDLEFSRNNKYLHHPSVKQYKPWKSYQVEVKNSSGDITQVKTAKHFYHRWQIHQIYEINKKYPVFAKHNWLLQHSTDKIKDNYIPGHDDGVATLLGKAKYFDALSFYIELYQNEQSRTFSLIPENDGIKYLNDQQLKQYEKRLIKHAKFTLNQYCIDIDELIQFLIYTLELHSEYQDEEKIKLANDLKNDILFLIKFITRLTGQSFFDLENEISKRTTVWVKNKFRHLDKALEAYDYSRETFERLMVDYNKIAPVSKLSLTDIYLLLDFVWQKRLFIIPYVIFDIDETLNNNMSFHKTILFNGLSNLTTGLECFLREIANIANKNSGRSIDTKSLHSIIKDMFPWGNVYDKEHSDRMDIYKTDAISYISDVHTDQNLDEVVKAFLIAHRARNFVAHNYILERDLYYGLYSIVYTAIIHALFYGWVYAKKANWV